jgi:hypothetical protein
MPAFCIAGEAEWWMGWPSTAQYRVLALKAVLAGSDIGFLYATRCRFQSKSPDPQGLPGGSWSRRGRAIRTG